jgi:PAS domain S-box-containing protein
MNKQLRYVHTLLAAYSAGNFKKRLKLSNKLDETDAIISGIHMLGEELMDITISRDFFNKIFNTISEMVFVLSSKGIIEEVNRAACDQLGYEKEDLLGRALDGATGCTDSTLFRQIIRHRSPGRLLRLDGRSFTTAKGVAFPVHITVKFMWDRPYQRPGSILLTAKDVTEQLAAENLLLREMINALEQERLRLAQDFHDSLSQQLSGIKFLVGSVVRECGQEGLLQELKTTHSALEKILAQKLPDGLGEPLSVIRFQLVEATKAYGQEMQKLQAANGSLVDVLAEIRSICFDLMPRTLADFGLLMAVREYCNHAGRYRKVRFSIYHPADFPTLPKDLEIDLFRIIQEFIANALKHGKATLIKVQFSWSSEQVRLQLTDNGKGFWNDNEPPDSSGMGIRNMQSRVKSHNGIFKLNALPGKGTALTIQLPLVN